MQAIGCSEPNKKSKEGPFCNINKKYLQNGLDILFELPYTVWNDNFLTKKEVTVLRSIIELIGEAEEQAAAIRRDASAQARDATAQAQERAKATLAAEQEKGRAAMRAALAKAEEDGKKAADEVLAENRQEIDSVCAAAREKLDAAATYLLERVVEI